MKYVIDDLELDVIIERKNNKNTYVKIKDFKIIVTTNIFVSNKKIKELLDNNYPKLQKMLNICKNKSKKETTFYYLGKPYDIILSNSFEILDGIILVPDKEYLNKWLKKQTKIIFKERLDILYKQFDVLYPNLKIRKMTTRWGVCNRKNNTITLNSELIKYSLNEIDYVIIHELCHFIYFDHSKNFYNEVEKRCKNYKEIKKVLKEQ